MRHTARAREKDSPGLGYSLLLSTAVFPWAQNRERLGCAYLLWVAQGASLGVPYQPGAVGIGGFPGLSFA